MNIRLATAEDAEAIAKVHIASWQEAYKDLLPQDRLSQMSVERSTDSWQQRLQAPQHMIFVAEADSEIIGFSSVGPSRDDDAQSTIAELYAIYLLSSEWGKGTGKALWQKSVECLKQEGYQSVTLWVFKDNPRARQFYEGMGFILDDREETFEIFDVTKHEVRYKLTF